MKKISTKTISILFSIVSFFILISGYIPALAIGTIEADPNKGIRTDFDYKLLAPIGDIKEVSTGGSGFGDYLQRIVKIAIGVTGAISVLILVWGGVEYIFSSVSETAKKDAKERVTNAIFGLLIALSSYVLLRTIGGESVLQLGLPTLNKVNVPGGSASQTGGDNNTPPPPEDVSAGAVQGGLGGFGGVVNPTNTGSGQSGAGTPSSPPPTGGTAPNNPIVAPQNPGERTVPPLGTPPQS